MHESEPPPTGPTSPDDCWLPWLSETWMVNFWPCGTETFQVTSFDLTSPKSFMTELMSPGLVICG